MPRQTGKALALDTPIPTPSSWTTMGDLKVGDFILSPSGDIVSVTMKTETMYNHNCYKLYFDNGDEIVADADHLWEVNSSYWRTGKKVINTDEIYSRYLKKTNNKRGKGVEGSLYIDLSKAINGKNQNLPIDPYLLGVWLGDGYSADGRVIAHKDDYKFYKTKLDIEKFISKFYNNDIKFNDCDGKEYQSYKHFKINEVKVLLFNNSDKITNDISLLLTTTQKDIKTPKIEEIDL
jgi:hypothetical protein